MGFIQIEIFCQNGLIKAKEKIVLFFKIEYNEINFHNSNKFWQNHFKYFETFS